MKAPVRVAVIGAGQFGTLHAKTLARMPEAEFVALVDPNLPVARELGTSIGVAAIFESLAELIASKLADAVIIATRADTHLSLAEEAVRAGLAVLVEKPLANSAVEISEFQRRIAGLDSVVMVDHLCLFHSLIVPLRERLRETPFRALNFVRHRPEAIGCRFPEDHPIQLVMVHDLYVAARMVNGENPVEFRAMESRNAADRVDMSWASLRWADGRIATFQCHMMLPDGVPSEGWDRVEVFGDGFYSEATTNPAPWTWSTSKREWPVNLEVHDSGGMLVALLRNFIRASQDGQVAEGCRVEDALQVQEWIERLLKPANLS